MSANNQLRYEREQRGWSQQKVAEAVGVTARTISRWEMGLARPYPHFREQLCQLFNKSVDELGLLNDSETPDAPGYQSVLRPNNGRQHPEPAENLNRLFSPKATKAPDVFKDANILNGEHEPTFPAIYDPAIPPSLSGHVDLIGRSELLKQLKQQLQIGEQVAITALNGLPGVGKTAMAIAIAADQDIQARFHDGILWAGLGQAADVPGLLRHWGLLLGLAPGDMESLQGARAWSIALRRVIGQRRMLFIIDDAWSAEEALALHVGGSSCSYLVTTRLPTLAFQVATDGVFVVPELNEQDGISLLNRFIPDIVGRELGTARELVRLVGGLPLAQVLIGKHLHMQTMSGQPRRLQRAIEQLRTIEQRLKLTMPMQTLALPANVAQHTPWSLQAAIALSDQHLDQQSRQALRALSVFPPKPNTFSEEAALAVCQVPIEVLDTLSDSGLLESQGANAYTLHQTIADYARLHLQDQRVRENLVDYYTNYVEANQDNLAVLARENTNIAAALEIAYTLQEPEKHRRLFGVFSLRFLLIGDLDLYERHVQKIYAEVQSSGKGDDLIQSLLQVAHLQERRGAYKEGEDYLQRALALAEQEKGHPQLGIIHALLGRNALQQCNFSFAREQAIKALALGQSRQDKFVMYLSHWVSGYAAEDQSKLAEAEWHAQEILRQARQDDVPGILCYGLLLMSKKELQEKNYERAERYAHEGLAAVNAIGHDEYICTLLETIIKSEIMQGKYQQACEHVEQGLSIAQKRNLVRNIGMMQVAKGDVLLLQKRIAEAEVAFSEANENTPPQCLRVHALALYGLARVEAERANWDMAREYGKKSMAIYSSIGHYELGEVSSFMETLQTLDCQ
ncbi:MAG: hypothetical protein NVSMB44_22480 [Ktedonobacteraceae bacterium]